MTHHLGNPELGNSNLLPKLLFSDIEIFTTVFSALNSYVLLVNIIFYSFTYKNKRGKLTNMPIPQISSHNSPTSSALKKLTNGT